MEPLIDPVKDRVVKSIKAPPHRPLSKNIIFPNNLKGKPDWRALRDHMQKEGTITKEDLTKLVQDANKIFKNEGNLIYLQEPVSVVGDIHGQFYDAIKILEVGGNPDNNKYLFLGDFVDRGSFSIECLVMLYAIKINNPETVYMLRGNHECRQMTTFFNFRAECLYKYDQEVYEMFMDSFDLMPLACVLNGKFLAVHGGLSPEMHTLDDINKLERVKEPPKQGMFCDLLWADPVENPEGVCENIFRTNDVRGCSYFYGNEAVSKFLNANNLLSIIRAHEAQPEGYKMHAWNGKSDFPAVITIFSAPNYCDVYKNRGAIIKFEHNTLNIQQYNFTPHPYILPNFMDIFSWSIPFVSEKITEMLYHLLKQSTEQDDDDDDDDEMELPPEVMHKINATVHTPQKPGKEDPKASLQKRGEILKNKLKFISKMAKMNKTLREQNETIVRIKDIAPDNKIPTGLLSQGGIALKDALDAFSIAKKADIINEKRPEFK